MTPDAFGHWRERKAYTLAEAARALGLSRRMVAHYEKAIARYRVSSLSRTERWISPNLVRTSDSLNASSTQEGRSFETSDAALPLQKSRLSSNITLRGQARLNRKLYLYTRGNTIPRLVLR